MSVPSPTPLGPDELAAAIAAAVEAERAAFWGQQFPAVGLPGDPGGPTGESNSNIVENQRRNWEPDPGPGGAGEQHSLQLIDASEGGTAKLTILAGTVHNGSVAEATFNVANNDKIWVEFTVAYSTGTGAWSASNSTRTRSNGAAATAESSTKAVVEIGSVTVSGGAVTGITQLRYGPIFWSRPGGETDYTSDWLSPGP